MTPDFEKAARHLQQLLTLVGQLTEDVDTFQRERLTVIRSTMPEIKETMRELLVGGFDLITPDPEPLAEQLKLADELNETTEETRAALLVDLAHLAASSPVRKMTLTRKSL